VLIDTTQLALERSISGAAQRHEALAANLANATTPGYRRVDVDFDGSVGATQGDGDSIDVDSESAKLAANALEQQAAVSVAKTRNAILRAAMGVA
jgi:flagellar basal-body rod protein FlgB